MIAGGAESMSQAEFYATEHALGRQGRARGARRTGSPAGASRPAAGTTRSGGMIETAENLRREYGIARAEQDEFALRSHQRAVAAQQDGMFAEEIVPVDGAGPGTGARVVDTRRAPARRHLARDARAACGR